MSEAHSLGDWWSREDLCFDDRSLQFAGRRVQALADEVGTPAFFYHGQRVLDNVVRLRTALDSAGFRDRFRIHYAMKANRFAPLLTHLKHSQLVGIDACSPNEVELALSCGFRADEVSFTANSLSVRDVQRLSRIQGLTMNCDSIAAIRRWGELGSGRNIGLRINPARGIGRSQNDKLQYSGAQTTKFGIYREQFADALAVARQYDLTVDTIHFHTGCGYLTPQLSLWETIIEECLWFIRQVETVTTVNVGGGLGVPHVESDEPLDLARWAGILAKHFLSTPWSLRIEPGDYIVKDAGLLLLTVNTVERKRDTRFVGVDAGFNLAVEPAMYGLPFHPVPAIRREGQPQVVTIVGNINEALDVWYADVAMAELREGDCLALINAGAYSTSMASNHCMRGEFKEFLLL